MKPLAQMKVIFLFAVLLIVAGFVSCKDDDTDTVAPFVGTWRVGNTTYTGTFTTTLKSPNPTRYYYGLFAYVKMPETTPIVDIAMIYFMERPTQNGTYKIVNKTAGEFRAADEIMIEVMEEKNTTGIVAKALTEGKTASVTVKDGKISIVVPSVNAGYAPYANGLATNIASTTIECSITEK